MTVFTVAVKCLQGRFVASALTAFSMALGVSLIIASFPLTRGIKEGFIEGTTDYSLVVGAAISLCMACMHLGLLASAEETPRLTFTQLVDSIKAELEVTQKIKSYGGKEVEMQGFIIPAGLPRSVVLFAESRLGHGELLL